MRASRLPTCASHPFDRANLTNSESSTSNIAARVNLNIADAEPHARVTVGNIKFFQSPLPKDGNQSNWTANSRTIMTPNQ